MRIEAENADRIIALCDVAKRVKVTDDRIIEVDVPEDARYIRFECRGRVEQVAWTQPMFLTD